MEKISRCVEHTEGLTELVLDVNRHGKQIVTTWLDLQNRSVPHNLIQFALEWYHVPEHIRKLVFNYYDDQFIRVKSKEWTTDWMQCFVGVFQGYPLSCILFLAVFSLCLDRLDGLKDLGYHVNSNLASTAKAYADDLTLTAKAHAMKMFVPYKKMQQEGYETQYVAFVPKLTKGGKEIAFILSQPVRFLGKLIYKDLKADDIRNQVTSEFQDLLQLTEKSKINGILRLVRNVV